MYEFGIKKEQNDNTQNVSESENTKVVIFDEILSCYYVHGEDKCRMANLINTSSKEVFTPRNKYQELFVINTQNNGLITMNALLLAFKYESENAGANHSKHEYGSFSDCSRVDHQYV